MLHQDMGLAAMLRAEVVQRREEGFDLGDLPERIEAAIADGTVAAQYDALWAAFDTLKPLPAQRNEPSELDAIRGLRPRGAGHGLLAVDRATLYDRVYGAWLGRCAGCTLGKPVEGWLRDRIVAYLKAAHAYPLSSYFPVVEPFPEGLALNKNYVGTALGRITHMVRDDDIDYTCQGLHILETYGRDFRTEDVARATIFNLPFQRVYTAEAIAYRNLVNGMDPPQTARYRNPYREWIGAQIRVDMYGYANPGHAERAAECAYRDAALTHTGNGIYGAMWAAACVSAALVLDDVRQVIAAGLAEIPADCRLAQAVRDTLAWADECATWEQAWERMNAKYGDYHKLHVINNTCLIVLGLLYGKGDLARSICRAVEGGLDTDCTGATTGSIVGAMRGAQALPDAWIAPLNDRLESLIPGFADCRISDLARRTVALVP
jgi:ADP-ribosylglycohydrolase